MRPRTAAPPSRSARLSSRPASAASATRSPRTGRGRLRQLPRRRPRLPAPTRSSRGRCGCCGTSCLPSGLILLLLLRWRGLKLVVFYLFLLLLAYLCYGARTSGRRPPCPGLKGRHRASPIHRRRARAASFITAYLLLSRTASANPPEQCATFARSINLSRDLPLACT